MKKTLLLLLVMAATLQSCYQKPETIANNDIDPKLRETIKAKNDSLFEALSDSNSKVLEKLGSEKFNKFLVAKLNGVIWPFRKGYLTTDHEVYEEFYNKHTTVPDNSTIISAANGYTLTFQNEAKETYVSLLTSSYMGIDDYLITVIYCKRGNDWKIEEITAGLLSVYGKNAAQSYALAKEYYEKGYEWDAYQQLNIARQLLEPAQKLIKYPEEEEIMRDYESMDNKINSTYTMPQPIESINTKPIIQQLAVVKNAEGIFPLISYTTQIRLSDSVSLNNELKNIKAEVKEKFKWINFKQKYIYYRAYNVSGNGLLEDSYTFTEKN